MRSIAAILGSIAVVSPLFAGTKDQLSKLQTEVKDLAKSCQRINQRGVGIYVFGDYLHWRAAEDNIEEVIDFAHPISMNYNIGKIIDLDFHYGPGFRIGAGYTAKKNLWDLQAVWTRFHTEAKMFKRAENGNTLTSLFGEPGSITALYGADSLSESWKLHYDTIDGLFVPGCFGSRYFSFLPIIGLRGARIDQHIDIDTPGSLTVPGLATGTLASSFHGKLLFRAIGPLAGGIVKRDIYGGLNIVGKGLAAIVYGQFDLSINEPAMATFANGLQVSAEGALAEKFKRCRFNLQFALGLEWERAFAKERLFVNLGAYYEALIWFNQNQFYSRVNSGTVIDTTVTPVNYFSRRNGDLNMNGLTVHASFGF